MAKSKKKKTKSKKKKSTKKPKPKVVEKEIYVEKCGCDHNGDFCKGSAIYGLGFIGAAVFYISNATGFWMGVLGFLKACVWPAFLVFEAFKFLLG